MECTMKLWSKLLSGSEIINQKLNGPKELPTSGWKEYCPSNSWLEQKQIQASLEDKYVTIGVERIEKQSNLAQAEWISERKKAKVLKTVGKHWEVVGHHEDNEHWLLPEEALYLIEINVLELFHDGVPVSVEHAYALLLSESNNCTLPEYRVYSYLSRRGYKLIRHAEDITVTRYEKQVHLDQVLETHKRSIPIVVSEQNPKIIKQLPVDINIPETPESIIRDDSRIKEVSTNITHCRSKRAISDSEDVCIIEDNIEIIEIEDGAHKKISCNKPDESCTPAKQPKNQQVKSKIPECFIIIDEELEGKVGTTGVKHEQSDSSDSESDDDVILVNSIRLESRQWYKPLRKCLVPTEPVFVDLSDDNAAEIKLEKGDGRNESLKILANKSRKDILDEMTNAKSGISFIKSPSACFLPKEIVPRHSQYKVNLNMRQEPAIQHSENFYAPNRRLQQFYNPNFSVNQTNNTFFGDNVLMQACEMRAMAISMIQAASSLMSAVNNTQTQPSPPLVNDIHIPPFYNSAQFSNPNYQPRLFNNMFNSNNLFSNSFYNNPRNTFLSRNPYGRRNFRFRGHRNNNNRTFPSYQKHMSRYNKVSTSNNAHEIVLIDSDDDSVSEQRGKRGRKQEIPPKKGKFNKPIEIIDLCEEKIVKNEPSGSNKNTRISDKQASSVIIEHDYGSDQNDIDQKPDILTECKQETVDMDVVESSQRVYTTIVDLKSEEANLQNVEESGIKNEKFVVSSEVVNTEKEIEYTSKLELQNKNSELMDKQISESPRSSMEIISSESPRIIEESNDSETVDILVESNLLEVEACLPEKELSVSIGEQPTSWQQFKERTEQIGRPEEEEMRNAGNISALTQPDHNRDIASLLKNLQIFQIIDIEKNDEEKENLKISFDAYLPTDHFKKSLKMLPKFRIIVVKSTDSLPSSLEIGILQSSYQDGIPTLYALVYDDAIAFYYYDHISLQDYCDN